ncbi:MAG TPA: hypothetical protein VN672_06230 [Solirubrobacteraceae bacterium]|nr:hypothetical protein [Solirubrobacteraceae bacterium]
MVIELVDSLDCVDSSRFDPAEPDSVELDSEALDSEALDSPAADSGLASLAEASLLLDDVVPAEDPLDDEVTRAFEDADNAGSWPEASWT